MIVRGEKASEISGVVLDRFSARKATFSGSPISSLLAAGLLLILAIIFGTSLVIDSFRERSLKNAERDISNNVSLLAHHFEQQLADFDALQQHISSLLAPNGIISPDDFKLWMSSPSMHKWLVHGMEGLALPAYIDVFDATGNLINSSNELSATNASIASYNFFQALKNDTMRSPTLIQLDPHPSNGAAAIVLAHRMSGPNGEFLGLTTRALPSSILEAFFASISSDGGDAISAYDTSGTMLARFPRLDDMIGHNFGNGPVHQQILSKSQSGLLRIRSPVDGRDRLAAARRLSNFPISIVATRTIDAALSDWRDQTQWFLIIGCTTVSLILLMLFLVIRQIIKQHRASEIRLALEKHRLDTAINNMNQGLMLFDAEAKVVVVNQSYLEMYRLHPDAVQPGCHLNEVVASRKGNGSFKGDVETYCRDILVNVRTRFLTTTETVDGRIIQISSCPVSDGGWVATHEDVTERHRTEERISHLAHYDSLTDLPNRLLFQDRLEHELARADEEHMCAVIYIDIDEFKSINDSLGHTIGDEFLREIAIRLSACARDCDLVARLGGDEFAVIQTGIKGETDVLALISDIQSAIREPAECGDHRLLVDASIGAVLSPNDGTNIGELLKKADLAMYAAKADGRRTFRFFELEMDTKVRARRELETDLRDAVSQKDLANGGFEIYYQPLLNLTNDRITGCEALLRWRRPQLGMVSPAEFIPVAEEIGLICELGEWVLHAACKEAAVWPSDIRLAVNVSPVQFRNSTLPLKVASALASSGLPPNRLELEITEAVLIRDDEATLKTLHHLRDLGVRIALDDFGTGYSSLGYLNRFPFDKIKIDRCFVSNIAEHAGSSAIVQAVVCIAASQAMSTTAEGVETEQQKIVLHALGCTEMQGFLFSPARPVSELRALLASHLTIDSQKVG